MSFWSPTSQHRLSAETVDVGNFVLMIDLDPAAREVARLLDGVADDRLADPTPCPAYPVGALLDHLMGLSLAFMWAARKTTATEGDGDESRRAWRPRNTWIRNGAPCSRGGSVSWSRPGAIRRPGKG
jgi:hypothetical protein